MEPKEVVGSNNTSIVVQVKQHIEAVINDPIRTTGSTNGVEQRIPLTM
jgi:hypothetical protein